MKATLRSLASILAVLFLLSPLAHGQVTRATIYGRVLDSSGGVVPGALITLTNTLTGVAKSATSNERGEFTLTFLPVGTYEISIAAAGFKTFQETGLRLAADQKQNLTYTLQIGEVRETVTVTAEAAFLNSTSAQQNITHTPREISELPLARRNFTHILNVGTGVSREEDGIAINGLPIQGFTFTVDGTDSSGNMEVQSLGFYNDYDYVKGVSVEAIEEVQVSKNIFSAEIANAMAGNVNVITKSGSNRFHGSVFENYQAGGLNARPQFIMVKSPLIFHQFGGSLGGPVLKNRMFFFTNYEGYRQTAMQTVSGNVPAPAFKEKILAAVPAYKPILDQFPLPTDPVNPGSTTGFYRGLGAGKGRENHALFKWDYNLSNRSLVSAKYVRGRPFLLTPNYVPANARTYSGKAERVNISFTRIAPRWSSETRFGFNTSNTERLDGIYRLGVTAINSFGFSTGGETFSIKGDFTSFEEVVAVTRGRHSIKTGGIFSYARSGRENQQVPVLTYSTEADLLANIPSSVQSLIGPQLYQLRMSQFGFFASDDMRLNPRLLVNMGIRYDYYTVPKERDNRLLNRSEPFGFGPWLPPDSPYKADYNNFSPRVGIAWTMDKARNTVLKGGIGIYQNPHPAQGPVLQMVRDLKDGQIIPTDFTYSRLQALAAGIRYPITNDQVRTLVTTSSRIGGFVVSPDFPSPYSIQLTLGLERRLAKAMVGDISYQGNRGVKLVLSRTMNLPDRVTGLSPYPNYLQFTRYDNSDSTHYHSFQTSLKKRFSKNLGFNAYYTWSRSIGFSERGDLRGGSAVQDNNNLSLERGPTRRDVNHNFVADFLFEIPYWSGIDSKIAKHLLAGWQVSGIANAQTGDPVTLTQRSSISGSRPDFVGNSIADAYVSGQGLQYLNPKAFARVPIIAASGASARPGNLSRGAIRTLGWWNTNLALSKNFLLREGMRLQIRADMLNALNHTNLSGFSTNLDASNFGMFTSTRGARVVQLNARFVF